MLDILSLVFLSSRLLLTLYLVFNSIPIFKAGPHKWRQKRAEEATQVKKQKRHRKAPVFTAQSEP